MTGNANRVLFLYLPTGGGHASNAKAIGGVLSSRYGAEVRIFDPVSDDFKLMRIVLEDGYRLASLKVPFVWEALYRANEREEHIRFSQSLVGAFARKGIARALDEFKIGRAHV